MKEISDLKTKNDLWQARQRSQLQLKQVAFLLSKNAPFEIQRYEKGPLLPNLEIAMQLEIVYKTPIRLLFSRLFEFYKKQIAEIIAGHPNLFQNYYWQIKGHEQLQQEEYCFYGDLLKNQLLSRGEIEVITKHIIALSNSISDYKQDRKTTH